MNKGSNCEPAHQMDSSILLLHIQAFSYIFIYYFQFDPVTQPIPGAQPRTTPAYNARFWHMNTFIVFALACNLIILIFYTTDGMMKSAAIEASGIENEVD